MATNTDKITTPDHSIGHILIMSLLVLCGLTSIVLLGIF